MRSTIWLLGLLFLGLPDDRAFGAGDAAEGGKAFRQCLPCHSLEPGRHMTGPSLDHIFGRKAGTVEGFERYTPALEASGKTWDEGALDAWLKNPSAFIPGSRMTFALDDAAARSNLIAYLKALAAPDSGLPKLFEQHVNLKDGGGASRIKAIGKCRDTYKVTMENGATLDFWENSIRFKTDSSKEGPEPGKPVLQPTGMHGDRAFAIFNDPAEISPAIKPGC